MSFTANIEGIEYTVVSLVRKGSSVFIQAIDPDGNLKSLKKDGNSFNSEIIISEDAQI